ncbi:MAG: hypothetical protein IKW77_07035 [Salinivirgaceae bacterium]|nr:hypothetical protein [Salinivirgaceae bacterium]
MRILWVKCNVTEITSGGFIMKYHLKAASSVRSALDKLIRLELIYKNDCEHTVYDRFMNEWLKKSELIRQGCRWLFLKTL